MENKPTWQEWLKKVGWAGFAFFLIKGLLWLIVPILVANGLIQCA